MTLALLGAGMMGESVLAGMVSAGVDPADILVVEKRAERVAELAEKYGVGGADAVDAVAASDTVLLIVKPHDAAGVLREVASGLDASTLVVSLCAGLATAQLEEHLPPQTPVVRVMPNTPARVGAGLSAISAGTSATEEHLERVRGLLAGLGEVVVVPEKQQDAITAISGSGPAYLFLVAEALIEAGVHLGLSRADATTVATQTIYGSGKLLKESGEHPALLREAVTSPAGTTAAGLRKLEDAGLRSAFLAAAEAARDRSVELGQ